MDSQQIDEYITTLAYFLRNGKLGKLAIGMDVDAILKYLGLSDGFEPGESSYDSIPIHNKVGLHETV